MGNLLGAPVTDKETHRGVTKDEELKFGVSSMQGWRVHMEDAHIAEGELYALEVDPTGKRTKIPLKGHALFAVYDGHGGTFAAIYSGSNFLRVLSKQSRFVQYAKMCASDSSNNNRAGKMRILEQALKQAFVETDYEIGLAIRGKSHEDANSPYHEPPKVVATTPSSATIDSNPSDEASENESSNHDPTSPAKATTPNSSGFNTPNSKPAMAGAAMKAASDHLSAIEDEGDSGTTTCVVVVTPDSIVCANAGDSRAIFARRPESSMPKTSSHSTSSNSLGLNDSTDSALATTVGKAIPLSFDHKPDDEEEEKRIRNAGGYVTGGRVEGDLAVSRGLGDFRFKQMSVVLNNTQLYPEVENSAAASVKVPAVASNTAPTDMATDDEDEGDNDEQAIPLNDSMRSKPLEFPPGDQKVSPIPDVTIHMRNHERDEYVVVACDGIWDVVSNQQCISELDEIMYAEGERDLGLVSEEVRIVSKNCMFFLGRYVVPCFSVSLCSTALDSIGGLCILVHLPLDLALSNYSKQILDTCLRYGSKDNMTAIVVQLPGCEKSYADAAKSAAKASSSETTEADKGKQEGVAGRRRKREEAMATAQQQQKGAEDHAYVGATPYGVSAPE
jgi:serine/threonine protein phosphatase PrpC